jgi:predicted permease
LLVRVVGVFRRRAGERELTAELRSHVDMHTADNVRAGMSPEEARRQALIALGGIEQTKERYRERRSVQWLDELLQDIRFSIRLLLKDRGFTLTAVIVLALGIGANAAIFSVVDALVLRPLPYHEADRLVMIWEDAREIGFANNTPAPGNYFSWKRRNRTFSDIAATRSASANLTLDGPPELVIGRRVTSNFFDVLGVHPFLGRVFTEEEDRTGEPVTIVSHRLWQRRYSSDPNILGKSIVMNGQRRTIIGVMPGTFVFRDRERDFWNPIQFTPAQETLRDSHFLNVVGRLAPGATVEDARNDIQAVTDQLKREYPNTNGSVGAVVESLKRDLLGDTRSQLMVLSGASLCVLLIACANVAGLLLLRAMNRRGELAIRASLGATGGRIARQLVAEAIVLALAGAGIGVALAPVGAGLLADLVPTGMLPVTVSMLDMRLVGATLLLALFTAVAFSLGPALRATRAPLAESLQHTGRSRVGGSTFSRDVLVVGQLAVAVVLLVCTGLLLRTFANLRGSDLGFRPDQLLTVRTTIPVAKYAQHEDRVTFFGRVIAEVRSLPGVQDAAYVSTIPFGSIGNTTGYTLEGAQRSSGQDVLIRIGTVTYLKTIGVELIEGRLPDERDQSNAPWVVVVNERFARLSWPDRSAIGRRVSFGEANQFRAIIGVIRDVKERGYDPEEKLAAYIPAEQFTSTAFVPETLVVRASGDLESLVPLIRRAVAKIDPQQPLSAVRTMNQVLDLDVGDRKQQAMLLGIFAAIAVLLAALGLYGLLAYSVAQRRKEIAVRMAVGASARSVMRAIAAGGQKLILIGLFIGLAVAWGVSRTMEASLHGITPSDPLTFAAAGAALWLAALLATSIPALRASRVNPAGLLRGD